MIGYLLILFGLGDLAGLVHFFTHHRTGASGLVLAFGGWVAHRFRRRFKNTGRRVVGMPPLKPLAERRAAA